MDATKWEAENGMVERERGAMWSLAHQQSMHKRKLKRQWAACRDGGTIVAVWMMQFIMGTTLPWLEPRDETHRSGTNTLHVYCAPYLYSFLLLVRFFPAYPSIRYNLLLIKKEKKINYHIPKKYERRRSRWAQTEL